MMSPLASTGYRQCEPNIRAIQDAERHSRHRKEVKGYNRLAMIIQESKPALAGITAPSQPSQISGNRGFGNLEAELLEFPMDLWCTPVSVLQRHHTDETLKLLAYLVGRLLVISTSSTDGSLHDASPPLFPA